MSLTFNSSSLIHSIGKLAPMENRIIFVSVVTSSSTNISSAASQISIVSLSSGKLISISGSSPSNIFNSVAVDKVISLVISLSFSIYLFLLFSIIYFYVIITLLYILYNINFYFHHLFSFLAESLNPNKPYQF